MARGQKSEVGDTRWSPNNYHYTRTEEKWELTHKLVIEKHLGRKLLPNERVRYKDNNKKNYNDPDNLQVYVVKQASNQKRRATLEAKLAEIQAELDALDKEEQAVDVA